MLVNVDMRVDGMYASMALSLFFAPGTANPNASPLRLTRLRHKHRREGTPRLSFETPSANLSSQPQATADRNLRLHQLQSISLLSQLEASLTHHRTKENYMRADGTYTNSCEAYMYIRKPNSSLSVHALWNL